MDILERIKKLPGGTKTIVFYGQDQAYHSQRGKTEVMCYIVPEKPPAWAIADTLEDAVALLEERFSRPHG